MRKRPGSALRPTPVPVLLVALLSAACSTNPASSTVPADTSSPTRPSSTTIPLTTTTEPAGETVGVPDRPPPAIDGVLSDGEWDGALAFGMSDGAPLRIMHHAETLYLSVEATEVGSVNVVLEVGDQIWILHSSAALGSALYTPGPDEWALVHGFSWCCRASSDATGRLALLEEEGWQANIGFTGTPGIVEYQIAIPWKGASMAVSSIRSDEDAGFWPATLSDGARLQIIGSPPPTRMFNTQEWPVLEPAGG